MLKTPARMSKADLLEAIGRRLTKQELIDLNLAVQNGYRPFVTETDGSVANAGLALKG
jgi:hypothetical protein